MPPDTTQLPGTVWAEDSHQYQLQQYLWKLSMERHLDSLEQTIRRKDAEQGPRYLLPQPVMFLLVLGVLLSSFYWVIIRPARRDNIRKLRERKKATEGPERELQFDQWLSRYNPYYQSLDTASKQLFLYRVQRFMQSKEFRFHSMSPDEKIPVLISAAAVQLTFGLRNYLLSYFHIIHILPREYVLHQDQQTYYGHVSNTGIYISWNKFGEGFEQYNDSVNLGLHEMAHALQFDAFLGPEDRHDMAFKERLNNYAEEGRPVFRAMRKGGSHLLADYASQNFDEFWAVSVETFFENPVTFRERLPQLYEEMCQLLNQDPAVPGTVLDASIRD